MLVLDGVGYYRSQQAIDKAKEMNIKRHYLPPVAAPHRATLEGDERARKK